MPWQSHARLNWLKLRAPARAEAEVRDQIARCCTQRILQIVVPVGAVRALLFGNLLEQQGDQKYAFQ